MEDLIKAVEQILLSINEDPNRHGLKETPNRVAKSLKELTVGYGFSASDVVKDAIFLSNAKGLVVQKNIEFYSLCEHHLLPFFGHVHIAYLPDGKILGLSKLGKLVDIFSKRLQVQEDLTLQIATALNLVLKPKGVAVMIEAKHFCMMMRGVKKQQANTITSEYLGELKSDQTLFNEFLQAIKM